MKIILLLLILSSLIFSQIIPSGNLPNRDTVLAKGTSSQKTYIVNDPSFFERYQTLFGSIIGAAAAALIAYISIKVTHKKQLNLENEKLLYAEDKKREHYRGILISINSIIISHKLIIEALEKEIGALLTDFKVHSRLAYEKPHTFIPIDLLKKLLIKLTEFENYNIQILYSISGYIISIDNLYNDLDFQPINKLKEEVYFKSRMEAYFMPLLGKINELGIKAAEIEQLLNKEIDNLLVEGNDVVDKIEHEQAEKNIG